MELVVSVISCRNLGFTDKSQCFPYASVDWQGQSYFTEVLSNTLRPRWRKGLFRLPFTGSLRNQNLSVSVFNCDPSGGGDDHFLGQANIDLYAAVPYDAESIGKRSRVYDDWVALEGGPAQDTMLRIQMVVDESSKQTKLSQDTSSDVDLGLLGDESDEESPVTHSLEPEQDAEDNTWSEYDGEKLHEVADQYLEEEAHYDETTVTYGEETDYLQQEEVMSSETANYLTPVVEEGRRRPSLASPDGEIQLSQVVRPSGILTTKKPSTKRRASLSFSPFLLKFQILEARDLVPRDPDVAAVSGPFPNAYCFVEWHDDILTTAAIEHTLNPKWKNEQFEISVTNDDLESPLPIYIRDYDPFSDSDIGGLGTAPIDLVRFPPNELINKWIQIEGGRGQLRISGILEGDESQLLTKFESINQDRQQQVSEAATRGEEIKALPSWRSYEGSTLEGDEVFEEPSAKRSKRWSDETESSNGEVTPFEEEDVIDEYGMTEEADGSVQPEAEEDSGVVYLDSQVDIIEEAWKASEIVITEGEASEGEREPFESGAISSEEEENIDNFNQALEFTPPIQVPAETQANLRRVQSKIRETPQPGRARQSIVSPTFGSSEEYARDQAERGQLQKEAETPLASVHEHTDPTTGPSPKYANIEPVDLRTSPVNEQRRVSAVAADVYRSAFVEPEDIADDFLDRDLFTDALDSRDLAQAAEIVTSSRKTAKVGGSSGEDRGTSQFRASAPPESVAYSFQDLESPRSSRKFREQKLSSDQSSDSELELDSSSSESPTEPELSGDGGEHQRSTKTSHVGHQTFGNRDTMGRREGAAAPSDAPFQGSLPSNQSLQRPQARNDVDMPSNVLASHRKASEKSDKVRDPVLDTHEAPFGETMSTKGLKLPTQDEEGKTPRRGSRRVEGLDDHANVRASRRASVFPTTSPEDVERGRNRFWQEPEDEMIGRLQEIFPELERDKIVDAVRNARGPPQEIEVSEAEAQKHFDTALRSLADDLSRYHGRKLALRVAQEPLKRQPHHSKRFVDMDPSPRYEKPLIREAANVDGMPVEPTGQRKALLIGCNYTQLSPRSALKRPLGPEMETTKAMLVETQGFPNVDTCFTVLGVDHAAGLNIFPQKEEILLGLDWLSAHVHRGDVLVLYFNGYRTLIVDNVDNVMVAEDGKEISKSEMVQHLHSKLPSGCRLTCLFDYHDRTDDNLGTDGTQKLIERDRLSSPYQFAKKQNSFVQLQDSYMSPADIRTIALKGQRPSGQESDIRNPMGLSLAAVVARHPKGLPAPQMLDEMEFVARKRGFGNVKPVLSSSQVNDLSKPFSFSDITSNQNAYKGPSLAEGEEPDWRQAPSVRSQDEGYTPKQKEQNEVESRRLEERHSEQLRPQEPSKPPPEHSRRGQIFSMIGEVPPPRQTPEPGTPEYPSNVVPHHHHVVTKIVRSGTSQQQPEHHHHVVTKVVRKTERKPNRSDPSSQGNILPIKAGYHRMPPPKSF